MTDPRCPVSWLALERHALGELGADERAAVDVHLSTCATCRGRRARILADQRPMSPMREPARSRRWPRWGWVPALAAAAAVLAVVRWSGPPEGEVRAKGDGVVLTLVRERDGHVVEDARSFRSRDRFRVLLTCPPGDVVVDIAVLQGEDTDYPLDIREPIACGSRLSIPGAFRISGTEAATVCAVDPDDTLTGCVLLAPL